MHTLYNFVSGPLAWLAFILFIGGSLYRVDSSGATKLLLDLDQSTADIGYIPETRTVLIPMLRKDTLLAYRLK